MKDPGQSRQSQQPIVSKFRTTREAVFDGRERLTMPQFNRVSMCIRWRSQRFGLGWKPCNINVRAVWEQVSTGKCHKNLDRNRRR